MNQFSREKLNRMLAQNPEKFPITTYYLGTVEEDDTSIEDWISRVDEEIKGAIKRSLKKIITMKSISAKQIPDIPDDITDLLLLIVELGSSFYDIEDMCEDVNGIFTVTFVLASVLQKNDNNKSDFILCGQQKSEYDVEDNRVSYANVVKRLFEQSSKGKN